MFGSTEALFAVLDLIMQGTKNLRTKSICGSAVRLLISNSTQSLLRWPFPDTLVCFGVKKIPSLLALGPYTHPT